MKGSSVKFVKKVAFITIISVYIGILQLTFYFFNRQPTDIVTEKTPEDTERILDSFDSILLKIFIEKYSRQVENNNDQSQMDLANENQFALEENVGGRLKDQAEKMRVSVKEINQLKVQEGDSFHKVDHIHGGKLKRFDDIERVRSSVEEDKLIDGFGRDVKKVENHKDTYEKELNEDVNKREIQIENLELEEQQEDLEGPVEKIKDSPRFVQSPDGWKGLARFMSDEMPTTCPTDGVLTVEDGGRLGNKIWEYAAVWGLAKSLQKAPYVPQSLLDSLGKVFQHLTLPALETIPRYCGVRDALKTTERVKRWQMYPLSTLPQRFPRGTHIALHSWIVLPEAILPHLRTHEFQFRKELRDAAQHSLASVRTRFVHGGGSENATFVGVHVRRTDFATWLPRMYNMTLADASYFRRAMDYFRHERLRDLGTPVFVVVSDDVAWCRRELLTTPDVFLASKSPAYDLALLAACNHSVVDYGTYGLWGALMAGGVTVSLASDAHVTEVMTRMRGWIFLQ